MHIILKTGQRHLAHTVMIDWVSSWVGQLWMRCSCSFRHSAIASVREYTVCTGKSSNQHAKVWNLWWSTVIPRRDSNCLIVAECRILFEKRVFIDDYTSLSQVQLYNTMNNKDDCRGFGRFCTSRYRCCHFASSETWSDMDSYSLGRL